METGHHTPKRARRAPRSPAASARPVTPQGARGEAFPWWGLMIAVGVTGAAFWPMLGNGFTNWDDTTYVVYNPWLRELDWKAMFTRPLVSNYHPLTLVSLAFNYHVSASDPFSYLLVNWLLHLANTALVFRVAWLVSGRIAGVALGTALVFGVHPMHVESVAWISERKDVLYAFFFLLGMLAYWRYLARERVADLAVTLALFVCALLSKPAAVVFPVVIVLLDWWHGRAPGRRMVLEKLPFFALSIVFGLLTFEIQSKTAVASLDDASLGHRLLFGSYGLVAYLVRFLFPYPLSAFHPYPPAGALPWAVRLAPLGAGLVLAAAWALRRRRALVFGLAFYVANVILVVQFVGVGYTLLSERYTYLPYVGLAFAAAMVAVEATPRRARPGLGWAAVAVIAVVFGATAHARVQVWRDSETLWSDVIRTYPGTPLAHTHRAKHYYEQAARTAGAEDRRALLLKALADCDAALATDPDSVTALDTRSIVNLLVDRPDAALADADRMVTGASADSKGYVVRGSALSRLGRYDEALADYDRALRLDSDNVDALKGRGTALFNGRKAYAEAIASFDAALATAPDAQTYLARSRAHLLLGNVTRARDDAERAERLGATLTPDYRALLSR